MHKIEKVELFHVVYPMDKGKPFWPSWIPGYPQTDVKFTFLKLTTNDGIVGCSAGNAFGKEREGLGDLLGKFLIGMDAENLDAVHSRLREASYLGWRNWWIETAFYDIVGQIQGKPIYKLLQKEEETVEKAKVYASTGSLLKIEQRKPYLDEIREMGFEAVKIRVHYPDIESDIKIITEVRKELGEKFIMGVDANQGWPVSLIEPTTIWSLDRALEYGRVCDDLHIKWLEEALDMHDWDGMATLRKSLKTTLLSGAELQGDWHELRALFQNECLDYYQPDFTFVGGLTVAKRVMQECRSRNLKMSPHTWTNGIGLITNLHVYAAWENKELLEFPYEPPGFTPEISHAIIEPTKVNPDGTIDIPQAPGLGLRIIPDKFRKYSKRFYKATPFKIALGAIREKGFKEAIALKKRKDAIESGKQN